MNLSNIISYLTILTLVMSLCCSNCRLARQFIAVLFMSMLANVFKMQTLNRTFILETKSLNHRSNRYICQNFSQLVIRLSSIQKISFKASAVSQTEKCFFRFLRPLVNELVFSCSGGSSQVMNRRQKQCYEVCVAKPHFLSLNNSILVDQMKTGCQMFIFVHHSNA